MAQLSRTISVLVSLCCGMAGTAAAQTAVEYGLNAGRAATTTAPGQGIGKAMSGLADSLDKAVKAGQKASDTQPAPAAASKTAAKKTSSTARVRTAPNTPPPPAQNWEDPSGISTGLSYEDLVRRFGPPALQISGASSNSLSYSGKDGTVQVEIQDGKVASIEKPKS